MTYYAIIFAWPHLMKDFESRIHFGKFDRVNHLWIPFEDQYWYLFVCRDEHELEYLHGRRFKEIAFIGDVKNFVRDYAKAMIK